MAAISVSILNGAGTDNPTQMNNLTFGTSAPAAGDFEFKFNTADANSNVITRVEILKALKAFKFAFESMAVYTTGASG